MTKAFIHHNFLNMNLVVAGLDFEAGSPTRGSRLPEPSFTVEVVELVVIVVLVLGNVDNFLVVVPWL